LTVKGLYGNMSYVWRKKMDTEKQSNGQTLRFALRASRGKKTRRRMPRSTTKAARKKYNYGTIWLWDCLCGIKRAGRTEV